MPLGVGVDLDLKPRTMSDRITKVFLVLNEETMEIAKTNSLDDNGMWVRPTARMFATERDADLWARERFEMWDVICSNFKHKFIHHEPNQ